MIMPFGWRWSDDGMAVEPDPVEQEIIAATNELRAAGLTERQIKRLIMRRLRLPTARP